MKKLIILFAAFFFSFQVFAADLVPVQTNAVQQNVVTAQPTTGVNDSAVASKKNNQQGGIIATLTAIGHFASSAAYSSQCPDCGSCCVQAVVEMALGMTASGQAGSNNKTAGAAGYTGSQSDAYGFANSGYKPATSTALTAGQDAAIKALTASGSKYDPKTGKITTADGKSYNTSDLTTPAGMAAAGLNDSQIKSLADRAKSIDATVLKKIGSSGFDDNGGGGGGGSSASKLSSTDDENASAAKNSGSGTRAPAHANVAGLTKDYNGEPIGVAQDGLFLMMTRRYKVKEKQDSFFSDAELIQK